MATPCGDTYDVLELIGKGSFGEIRRVRRHRDGMILCRKEIFWRRMKEREKEQLAAEIKILRELQHKNIVRYVSETVDQDTKMVYIYMEYCGNGDLHELIQSRKESSPVLRFSEQTVWQIFAQMSLALYRCHNGVDPPPLEDITVPSTLGSAQIPQPRIQNSVLHRDIKPQNVFLDHNNRVKLGDFGLSKELSGQNLADTYVGTPFYMSPEIIAGRAYNAKSDIWALGCVIYEMCAFEPPFTARDQMELNKKIKMGIVPSVTRFNYSEGLNHAIQSCLRQEEKMRPSAAGLLKRPEIIMARQQLTYFDREELLMEKEAALVMREKEIERAINHKTEEFKAREDNIARREYRLQRLEESQESILQDSVQRKLAEAQRQLEYVSNEKVKLEERLAKLQAHAPEARQHMYHAHSDFLARPQTTDPMMDSDPFDKISAQAPPRGHRPSIGRAQTELGYRADEDPLHLMPRPTIPLPRAESYNRSLKSPQRRKSQIPMSRIRPDLNNREPLSDQTYGVQGLTRALSKQDICKLTSGIENVRPASAMGSTERTAPRTPTRELSAKTLNSPRRMAYPSPTRATARTLFADDTAEISREHSRAAPPAPGSRANSMLEGLHKAKLQRDARSHGMAYDDDDIPSPFIKKSFHLKTINFNSGSNCLQ